jgi:hypothetical protein
MPPEQNKALVRRLLDELRNGWTPAVMEAFFSPGYRRYLNPRAVPLRPPSKTSSRKATALRTG